MIKIALDHSVCLDVDQRARQSHPRSLACNQLDGEPRGLMRMAAGLAAPRERLAGSYAIGAGCRTGENALVMVEVPHRSPATGAELAHGRMAASRIG